MRKFQGARQDAVKDPAAETRVDLSLRAIDVDMIAWLVHINKYYSDLSLDFNLAAPPVGRAVTMPGVMHKAVWAGGPTHLRELLKLASAA